MRAAPLALWLLASPAWAATLAVMPLEKGAGSEAYDGLGLALADMIAADLSGLEGVTLVERTRLDAVLAELELSKTAFIDPNTAQRLGKGLSADYVVLGTWSVVGPSFVVTARVVEVERSAVPNVAKADGTLEDWVGVEKELVETLLPALQLTLSAGDRRKLMVETPTESFDAFAKYGEGLDREAKGQAADAKKAYEAAVKLDPAFEEAKRALAALSRAVEEVEAARVERVADEKTRKLLAAVQQTVDERTRPKAFRHDLQSLGMFATRLDALERLGRHCDRYEELRAFVEREGLVDPARPRKGLRDATIDAYIAVGLAEPGHPRDRGDEYWGATTGSSGVFIDPVRLLFDLPGWVADKMPETASGLFGAAAHCLEPDAHRKVVADMRTKARDQGLADWQWDRTYPSLTFDEALFLHLAYLEAAHGVLGPDRQRELEEHLRAAAGTDREWTVNGKIKEITRLAQVAIDDRERAAKEAATRQIARMGLSEAQLWGVTRAYANGETSLLKTDTPICKALLDNRRSMAEFRVQQRADFERDGKDGAWITDQLWSVVAAPKAAGCLPNVPGQFGTVQELWAWLDARPLPAEPSPTCRDAVRGWERTYRNPQSRVDPVQFPDFAPLAAIPAYDQWFGMVVSGCVEGP